MAEYYSKDTVQALACEICGDCDACVDVCEFRDIKVDGLPTADLRLMEWIPITERLPETCKPVLVWLHWGFQDDECTVAEYWGDSNVSPGWGELDPYVTHWMPLPKLLEEGQA